MAREQVAVPVAKSDCGYGCDSNCGCDSGREQKPASR